jgi:hypothetical protein
MNRATNAAAAAAAAAAATGPSPTSDNFNFVSMGRIMNRATATITVNKQALR